MPYKKYGVLCLLVWSTTTLPFSGKSFLTYRPQQIATYDTYIPDPDAEKQRRISTTVGYSQSFDNDALNCYFFGANNLTFSGSRSTNRNTTSDILADYFGLPTDFKSTMSFRPRIQNIIADFDLYYLFSKDSTGWFLHGNTAVVGTTWKLNPCETIINPGTLAYPAGYMSNERMEVAALPQKALDVLQDGRIFGDLRLPLSYGRIKNEQHKTKFADVLIAVGYIFVNNDNHAASVDLNVTVPTGTRSNARNLFEPQIGNGHHWAIGAHAIGKQYLVHGAGDDYNFALQGSVNLQHLFKTTMKRSYDLKKSGPGSRYMLVEDMIERVSIAQGFDTNTPPSTLLQNQYITRLLYAIDVTTLDSTIKIDLQADIKAQAMLHYRHYDFTLGYNLWSRSKEKLVCRELLSHQSYGVKGDAQLYGFLEAGPGFEIPIPGNATQSQATIHAGQGITPNTLNNFINANADNAALMYNAGSPMTQTKINSVTGTGVTSLAQINGSNQAIVLTDADIDEHSGLSGRALSQTMYGQIDYKRSTQNNCDTTVSLGGQAEFASNINFKKSAVSQWAAWIKCSIDY